MLDGTLAKQNDAAVKVYTDARQQLADYMQTAGVWDQDICDAVRVGALNPKQSIQVAQTMSARHSMPFPHEAEAACSTLLAFGHFGEATEVVAAFPLIKNPTVACQRAWVKLAEYMERSGQWPPEFCDELRVGEVDSDQKKRVMGVMRYVKLPTGMLPAWQVVSSVWSQALTEVPAVKAVVEDAYEEPPEPAVPAAPEAVVYAAKEAKKLATVAEAKEKPAPKAKAARVRKAAARPAAVAVEPEQGVEPVGATLAEPPEVKEDDVPMSEPRKMFEPRERRPEKVGPVPVSVTPALREGAVERQYFASARAKPVVHRPPDSLAEGKTGTGYTSVFERGPKPPSRTR